MNEIMQIRKLKNNLTHDTRVIEMNQKIQP